MTEKKDRKYFDCIAFKRQAQKEMLEEYEANKDKFKTYGEYVK